MNKVYNSGGNRDAHGVQSVFARWLIQGYISRVLAVGTWIPLVASIFYFLISPGGTFRKDLVDRLVPYTLPAVLSFLVYFSLATVCFLSGQRRLRTVLFGLYCLFWGFLSLDITLMFLIEKEEVALAINRIDHLFIVFQPAVVLHFVYLTIRKKERLPVYAAYLAGLLLLPLTQTDQYLMNTMHRYSWGFFAKGNWGFQAYGVMGSSAFLLSLILLFRAVRKEKDPAERKQYLFIFVGIILVSLLTMGNWPALNGIEFYPLGALAFIPMLAVAYGVFRHDIIRLNRYTRLRIRGAAVKALVAAGFTMAALFTYGIIKDIDPAFILSRIIPYGIPPLLSFVVCAFLTVLALRVGENQEESLVFSILCLCYSFLSLDITLIGIVPDEGTALLISRASHAFFVFTPALYVHLLFRVSGMGMRRSVLFFCYALSLALSLSTRSELYFKGMYSFYWGFFARKAVLFDVLSIYGAVVMGCAFVFLLKSYLRAGNGFERHRRFYLLLGMTSLGFLTLMNVPILNGYEMYPFGNFIFIPFLLFAFGMFRYNVREMTHLLRLSLFYGGLVAAVALIHHVLSLQESVEGLSLTAAVVMLFVLVWRGWKSLLDAVFPGHGVVLRGIHEDLMKALSGKRSPEDIAREIDSALRKHLLAGGCGVLFHEGQGTYRGPCFHGPTQSCPPAEVKAGQGMIEIGRDNPLTGIIAVKRETLRQDVLEELIMNDGIVWPADDPLRQANMLQPVFYEDRLAAIILLGPKTDGTIYSREERDFLGQLGLTLGPHIENARILQGLEGIVEDRTRELNESNRELRERGDVLRETLTEMEKVTAALLDTNRELELTRGELEKWGEKYRSILESINEGYCESDIEGRVTFMNGALETITGYMREEMLGRSFREFLSGDSVAAAREVFRRIYEEDEKGILVRWEVLRRDGETRIVETSVECLRDQSGVKTGFMGMMRDITERVEAEEELRQSEEQYRHFVENAREIIFKTDWRGNFIFVNEAFQRVLGYEPGEILAMNYLDMVPSDWKDEVKGYYSTRLKERTVESNHELPLVAKDGRRFWIEQSSKSIFAPDGRIMEFNFIARDVTERKKAEDALRASEERFSNIMRNISDFIFICDYQGRFHYMNPLGAMKLGYTVEEICAMNFLHLVVPEYRDKELESYIRQYEENIEETYHEYPVLTGHGDVRWASQIVRMIRNDSGEPMFYGVARDITEQKKNEEIRKELEEQKTRFFANVSHEIRTPLTLMLAPIESYLQGDLGADVDRGFFESLHRNGLRLLKLINNLLDFSKIEAGRMNMRVVEIDMVKFIKNYVASLQSVCDSLGIVVAFMPPRKITNLFVDPEKIDKVFMNLLSNALKFTDTGGVISVRLREDEIYCYLDFEDTGLGIPPASREKIFERFGQAEMTGTRKGIGTGIGLALAKELVEMHGGTIKVQSRYIEEHPDDHGTVFTVTLLKGKEHFSLTDNITFGSENEIERWIYEGRFDSIREIGRSEAEAEKVPQREGERPVILVVDDNSDMRDFLNGLLGREYEVRTAVNGREGLDAMKAGAPDLVIADIMMPVMDGFEMTGLIRQDPALRHTPVIMLTARADMAQKIEGLEHGADDYLTKPFNSKELLARVRSILKTREYEKIIVRRNAEIEQEMEVARMLQHRLLPERLVDIEGYRAHAVYIPMDKVGGDFYDCARRGDMIDLFIADVSGHGLPGAFLAMMTKMAMESVHDRDSTAKTLAQVNDVIQRSTVNSNYVTAFFCTIDTRSNVLRYSNAGHLPTIVHRRRTGEFFELQAKGMPLGWFSDIVLGEETFQLAPGDRVILYTDGIPECVNPGGEFYGDNRFRAFIARCEDCSPGEFASGLISELKEFSLTGTFDDDLTILILDVA